MINKNVVILKVKALSNTNGLFLSDSLQEEYPKRTLDYIALELLNFESPTSSCRLLYNMEAFQIPPTVIFTKPELMQWTQSTKNLQASICSQQFLLLGF